MFSPFVPSSIAVVNLCRHPPSSTFVNR
jgi:hypothetical protein